ncbi:4 epimerase [Moumouvirus goulette]|uniref:4 epimerase n=1 Tax=Moumouvirus goulette TaxID=1247379 RepID=M1PBH2_9VIRU|nr:4 epimerase [Moumouvirus goulette]AGF85279.1 4 epimerase [Moumouvirus goulette]
MNVLITGITGFFGRNFTQYLKKYNPDCNIIGTAHSECKLAYFTKYFPDIKTYLIDLSSENIESELDSIVKSHNINYIVHSAAMKHVDICQNNPIMAMRVNAFSSAALVKVAKSNNIKNLIAISTDKANKPCNTYGITKYIMQENILSNGYSIYQGANFFWSDGSVLDIWFNQYIRNKPLTIRNPNHVRYFNTIDHVCERVYKNLDTKQTIILPDHVHVIRVGDLFDAFKIFFKYNKSANLDLNNFEKDIELLDERVTDIRELSQEKLLELIENFYKNSL